MPDISVLDVLLHGERIGTLTLVEGSRTLFAFNKTYIDNPERPLLSLSFKDQLGQLLTDVPPTNARVPPFFSNLLPEGLLREVLAKRARVSETREFALLWVLGQDLPGALTIRPAHDEAPPPGARRPSSEACETTRSNVLRFSLAGVQLKFSAVRNAGRNGGLTIPARV